jgi:hypothetical protein
VGLGQLSIERDNPQAWVQRRGRRRIVLRLLVIAGILLAAGVVGMIRHLAWAPIPMGLIFPLLIMANLVWIWSLFLRCPRCGNQFGVQARRGRGAARNPFAKSCMSCGLALRAER